MRSVNGWRSQRRRAPTRAPSFSESLSIWSQSSGVQLPTRLSPSPSTRTTPSAIAATTEGWPFFTGASFVDVQPATAKLTSIQRLNGPFRLLVIRHLHEGKAPGAPRLAISNDTDAVHCSVRLKVAAHDVFSRSKTQIPDENVLQTDTPLYSRHHCLMCWEMIHGEKRTLTQRGPDSDLIRQGYSNTASSLTDL